MNREDHSSLVALLEHCHQTGHRFEVINLDHVAIIGPDLPEHLVPVLRYWVEFIALAAIYPPEQLTACDQCGDLLLPNDNPNRRCTVPDCAGTYSHQLPITYTNTKDANR